MTSELATLHPAVFRVRYHLSEQSDERELATTVASISHQETLGVTLNAANAPATSGEIGRLDDYPHLTIADVTDGRGVDGATGELTARALARNSDIIAVGSIGGGDRAIRKARPRSTTSLASTSRTIWMPTIAA